MYFILAERCFFFPTVLFSVAFFGVYIEGVAFTNEEDKFSGLSTLFKFNFLFWI